MHITFQQMLSFDAVVSQGSIQAGAKHLSKTHPSVVTALKKLEDELGFALFDRSGYRSTLTEEGKIFHKKVKRILSEIDELERQSQHLRDGEGGELNIVLGDITPISAALKILHGFLEQYPFTRINLLFENIHGPNERLFAGEADLIIHYIDKSNPIYEYKTFCKVPVVPVVAPGFLNIPLSDNLEYSDLKDYTQCIIRGTGKSDYKKSYFVLPNSPHITVGDQNTKKEIIMQRMAWGHMPLFIVKNELEDGRLVSIEGNNVKGDTIEIVVARLNGNERSMMAERLWQIF
jgi:DNA-binding transcriptional LysR family regulator